MEDCMINEPESMWPWDDDYYDENPYDELTLDEISLYATEPPEDFACR